MPAAINLKQVVHDTSTGGQSIYFLGKKHRFKEIILLLTQANTSTYGYFA